MSLIEQGYEALFDSVSDGLMLQTRLKPYLDAVKLEIGDSGIQIDWSDTLALFDARFAQSSVQGMCDIVDFIRHPTVEGMEETFLPRAEFFQLAYGYLQQLSDEEIQQIQETGLELFAQGSVNGSAKADLFFGGNGNDTLGELNFEVQHIFQTKR